VGNGLLNEQGLKRILRPEGSSHWARGDRLLLSGFLAWTRAARVAGLVARATAAQRFLHDLQVHRIRGGVQLPSRFSAGLGGVA
jgi:hypothetical protein